jgi:hypothetical protein
MYRFSDQNGEPRQKVPIDGRTNVNNPEITRTFLQTLQGLPSWEEYLDLVNPKTVLWDTKFPLTAILDSHPDWCLVYPQDRKELLLSQRAVFVKSDLCEMIRGNAYAVDVKQSYLQGTTETDASHTLTFQTVLSSED